MFRADWRSLCPNWGFRRGSGDAALIALQEELGNSEKYSRSLSEARSLSEGSPRRQGFQLTRGGIAPPRSAGRNRRNSVACDNYAHMMQESKSPG